MHSKEVIIGGEDVSKVIISNKNPICLFAGPCVLESKDHALEMSCALKEITDRLGISLIYKTSFDKANRTSFSSERGLGLIESLPVLSEIRNNYQIPIITDVHLPEHCFPVSEVVDVLQIPAFLCRQTDLLVSAAKTGKPIHVKKGQFLSPWDMLYVVDKIEKAGCNNIMLCERGVSFGYNNLISDMRSLPILSSTGYPVVFDATHSVQSPGGDGNKTSGDRHFVEILARAAVAVGVGGIFIETHQDPDSAPSDGPNMIRLDQLENLLKTLISFDCLSKNNPAIVNF